jgi:hypothetical protein
MHVVVFADGTYEQTYVFETIPEARAFALGVRCGAQLNAGTCTAYVLPEDEAEMRTHENAVEIERAALETS